MFEYVSATCLCVIDGDDHIQCSDRGGCGSHKQRQLYFAQLWVPHTLVDMITSNITFYWTRTHSAPDTVPSPVLSPCTSTSVIFALRLDSSPYSHGTAARYIGVRAGNKISADSTRECGLLNI